MQKTSKDQGDWVKGRCTVCRDVTRHTVLAAEGEKLTLVRCNQCEDQHKFKSPPPSKAEKVVIAAARAKAKSEAADRERWAQMRPEMTDDRAKNYSMDGLFRKKDVIKHPVFGFGMVEKKAGPRKVEVLFADGRKVMRCQ
ncbi:MAG: hypothetical protein C0623_13735 [Desulfuromonas sp.]|nr:MAG: hypothetical protein C0623_13735 [Desulfuromonas sp.]